MEPLVSIIIPVYGVEQFIGQCLESVIVQTYKNLEVIIINDGTKDKSADIAKDYARRDSRIKVFDFENGGVSVARNRGLSLCKGDYIFFVDGDDWINKCMLQDLVNHATTNDVDMIKFGVEEIDLEKNKCDLITFKKQQVFQDKLLDKYFEGVLWIMPCNALYKRDLALQVKFPEHLTYEDNYTAAMYLALAKKY